MPTPTAIAERSNSADRRSHVIAAIIGCIIMASGLPQGTCRSRAAEPQQQPDTRFRETTTIDWDAIEPPPPPTGSPNVLLIVADDLGGRVGWEGHRSVKTPNLDALAARGRWYRHAYCQQSVCNPSRASMLTGRSLDRLGIADLETHFRRRDPGIVTLPQSFKRAGYHVHGIGKIFHNFKQDAFRGDPASWTAASILHYGSHGWDTPRVDGAIPPDELDPPVPRATRRDVPDDAYLDGRVATAAVDRLKQLARRDRPFFLAVGMWKPHTPFNAPSKYWAMYDDVDIAPPDPPEPPLGVPPIALHDNWEMMRAFKNGIDARQTRLLRQGYYAAITYMDAQVGRVLDELDRSDLRDDTIVVFTSDHGYHLGEHALWCKTSNFELDARVPLIVSGPGIEPSPSPTDDMVELVDLFPTLCAAANVSPPEGLDGVVMPSVVASATEPRRYALTQHPRPAYWHFENGFTEMGYSIRDDRFRYTRWHRIDDGTVIAREMYDHRDDPLETVNVVDRDDLASARTRLDAELSRRTSLRAFRTSDD